MDRDAIRRINESFTSGERPSEVRYTREDRRQAAQRLAQTLGERPWFLGVDLGDRLDQLVVRFRRGRNGHGPFHMSEPPPKTFEGYEILHEDLITAETPGLDCSGRGQGGMPNLPREGDSQAWTCVDGHGHMRINRVAQAKPTTTTDDATAEFVKVCPSTPKKTIPKPGFIITKNREPNANAPKMIIGMDFSRLALPAIAQTCAQVQGTVCQKCHHEVKQRSLATSTFVGCMC